MTTQEQVKETKEKIIADQAEAISSSLESKDDMLALEALIHKIIKDGKKLVWWR